MGKHAQKMNARDGSILTSTSPIIGERKLPKYAMVANAPKAVAAYSGLSSFVSKSAANKTGIAPWTANPPIIATTHNVKPVATDNR
jgi:hypothetical protein